MHDFCLQVVVIGLVHSRQVAPQIFLDYIMVHLNDPKGRNHHTIKCLGLTFPGSKKLLPEAVPGTVPQRLAKSLGPLWVIWVHSRQAYRQQARGHKGNNKQLETKAVAGEIWNDLGLCRE